MKTLIQIFLWTIHVVLYIFRDFSFVNINSQIGYTQSSEKSKFELYNYTHSSIEQFTSGMTVSELINLKWLLTLTFSLLFCSLSVLLLKSILNNWKDAIKYSITFYAAIILFGTLIYFILGYTVSRELMIIPQSPIASIILFMAVKIFKK